MTAIEEALTELEAAAIEFEQCHSKGACWPRLCKASTDLAALRVKEARENALYAPQWDYSNVPRALETFEIIRDYQKHSLDKLIALHPYNKEEGRYTGEVITGDELAELLEGPRDPNKCTQGCER